MANEMIIINKLQYLIDLVQTIGKKILPYWKKKLVIKKKIDNSPVCIADLISHKLLCQGLKKITPGIPIISEENCNLSYNERCKLERWWLIDPLDGTKDFLNGGSEFTINIAFVSQGHVLFGIVGVPVTGDCYYGGMSIGGSWKRNKDVKAELINVCNNINMFTIVISKYHENCSQEKFLKNIKNVNIKNINIKKIGSSLKLCLLAEGLVHFYPRLNVTSEWDIAAAQSVLEGAGGEVLDLITGKKLKYYPKMNFLNNPFIAISKTHGLKKALFNLANQVL